MDECRNKWMHGMDKQCMKPHIYLLNIIITIQNSWIPEPKQATNRVG